jgi:hypothetical protein
MMMMMMMMINSDRLDRLSGTRIGFLSSIALCITSSAAHQHMHSWSQHIMPLKHAVKRWAN